MKKEIKDKIISTNQKYLKNIIDTTLYIKH